MDTADISFIVTAYNQGSRLMDVIKGICESASSKFELILIDDASDDQTTRLTGTITGYLDKVERLSRFVIIRNRWQRFEVFCDNIGAKHARGKWLCFVQSDMVIKDPGFDLRLIQALEKFPDIGALSGHSVSVCGCQIGKKYLKKSGHAFSLPPIRPRTVIKRLLTTVNRDGERKSFTKKKETYSEIVHVEECKTFDEVQTKFIKYRILDYTDTLKGIPEEFLRIPFVALGRLINRGPIIMDRQLFSYLGGLNTSMYFQGFDDSDLCFRILKSGRLVGYAPVNYFSAEDWGSTRKKKKLNTILLIRINQLFRIRKLKKSILHEEETQKVRHRLIGKVFRVE